MPAVPPTYPVADPIAFLTGSWTVAREVHDDHSGLDGAFTGVARFVPEGDGLVWIETGRLRLGSHEGEASRTLRIVPEGDGWAVRFEDGRPFHPLDLRSGVSVVDHPCGEDHYVGGLRAESRDAVEIRWRVSGPTKDQTIVSRYTR